MPILKPTTGTFHKRRQTTTLHFEDKDKTSSEFIIRGGICWPMSIWEGGQERIEGYALMVGKNISSGVVTIFEETTFNCIDHVTAADGRIKYPGLAPWLNKCWTLYFCNKFYWRDSGATYEKYLREIHRSAMIKPKPQMPEVIWDDATDVDQLLSILAMHGNLVADKNGGFYKQQMAYGTNQSVPSPARHAAKCCVAGLDQFLWNRGGMDYD